MNLTSADVLSFILAVGSLSGLIIFLLNRKLNDKTTFSSISKTNKEIEQIEQDIESKYANQVKTWLEDLREITEKHEVELSKKDESLNQKDYELFNLHKQYLQAMQEISAQRTKLDRYNKATRRVLVNMDVPYWECSSDGSLVYVNGAWLQLFGISNSEAMGVGWLRAIPEENRNELMSEWNSRVVDQSEGSLEFQLYNQMTKEYVQVRSLYAIIFGADDEIYKIIGITLPIKKENVAK